MVGRPYADPEQKQGFGDRTVTHEIDTQRPITEALPLHLLLMGSQSPDLTQEAAMTGVAVEQMLEVWCVELRQ